MRHSPKEILRELAVLICAHDDQLCTNLSRSRLNYFGDAATGSTSCKMFGLNSMPLEVGFNAYTFRQLAQNVSGSED